MKISDVNEDKVGLFGYTMDSKISKLTLAGDIDGLSSTSQLYAGSIDAYAENTDISACNATYVNISNIVAGTSANSPSAVSAAISKAISQTAKRMKHI